MKYNSRNFIVSELLTLTKAEEKKSSNNEREKERQTLKKNKKKMENCKMCIKSQLVAIVTEADSTQCNEQIEFCNKILL